MISAPLYSDKAPHPIVETLSISAVEVSQRSNRARNRHRRALSLVFTQYIRRNLSRQPLPKLYAPLIERVHVPDDALHVDLVLVQRDELAECRRIETLEQ